MRQRVHRLEDPKQQRDNDKLAVSRDAALPSKKVEDVMATQEQRTDRLPLQVQGHSWSSLAFRGIASLLFGILAFAWPGMTLAVLTILFGAYAFADGVTALVVAFQRGARPYRWLLVVDGLIGIGAGVVTLLWPGITLLALIFIVALRFVMSGILQMVAAFQFHRELSTPVLYGLAGIASIALGVMTFIWPGVSAFVLVTMLGVYAFIFGFMMLVLSFRARKAEHRIHAAA